MHSNTQVRRIPHVFCEPDQKYVKLKVYINSHNSPSRRVMKNKDTEDITLSFSKSGSPRTMKRGTANCGLIWP